ncbi:DUF2460 domain-containing protein [Alphaproteobacteria bacterium KMM 3653]|uniref:DUF2460 domain-containing protein n=1 Tax=Harenicola maris TaxID=2841044 RepID=A0AAP2G7P8_9RHOB|nr:DUF2460 domain-containing protein [Harenicola maris]
MSFHEVRFPASLSFGSLGGPERRTEVVTLANGFEERNTPWSHSRRRYDAGMGVRSLDDVSLLIAFFEARRGRLYGFRWKDWADYKTSAAEADPGYLDQQIGVGDGSTRAFKLCRSYASGEASYTRPIVKPVQGSVRMGIEGVEMFEAVHYAVDTATGVVTFDTPPETGARVSAGFEFDVPVRFDTDQIQTSVANFRAGEVPNVPVLEVRV